MIIASMCTIPIRQEGFRQVVHRVLHEQTRPIDRLHVWLNGYQQLDNDLPTDARLEYHLRPDNPGPIVNWSIVDTIQENDIFVVLGDDLNYPTDYFDQGINQLTMANSHIVISYGGFCWDYLVDDFNYASDRYQYGYSDAVTDRAKISILMGGVSFFWAKTLKQILIESNSIFKMNDDMLVSYHVQQRGVPIVCCAKPKDWIRNLPSAEAEHALFRLDTSARHQVFKYLVETLGFDPTAGRLKDILNKPKRILVLANVCPPLGDSERLDESLRRLGAEDTSVHLLASVPASQIGEVQHYVNTPYEIHTVSVPEPGGRLDNIGAVRAWRNWRVRQTRKSKWTRRLETAMSLLKPTQILRYEQGSLVAVPDQISIS
jgi:hypothetical protein